MGIAGSLVGIQNNGETPVLELTNLHGDIIATASLSETATELASKTDTSEFGVPTVSNPEKYAWLGSMGLPTELPSGVIAMGVRSYVPQLGRFLQPDPMPGGSANAYAYTFGDPVNSTDPTGEYVEGSYLTAVNDTQNREAVEREEAREAAIRAAREAAARAAAEQAAREAAEAAAGAAGPGYEEWEGEEWYEEEEGEEEYAAFDVGPGAKVQSRSPQPTQTAEGGVFFQELSGEEDAAGQLTGERIIALRKCLTATGEPLATAEHYAACLRSVGFLGNLISGAKKFLHNASKAVVKAAKKLISWVKKHYAEVHEVSCLVQGIGVGTLVGVGATALSDGIGVYAAGVIGGTAGSAVTYACEHE